MDDVEVAHQETLTRFADALNARDEKALQTLRRELTEIFGPNAVADISAVAACFEGFNRIADACGLPT